MAKLQELNYLSISNVHLIIKYILLGSKRPKYVQLIPPPKKVAVVFIDESNHRDKISELEIATVLKNIYKIDENFHFKEGNLSLSTLFPHFLSSIRYNDESNQNEFKCIDLISLKKHIPLNDVFHLFSYTQYIKSKIVIEEDYFNDFIKPAIISEYELLVIDTEMVETTLGDEVGRVTLINYDGSLVLDKIIKPKGTVIDYRTKYSGLSEKDFDISNDNKGELLEYEELMKRLLKLIGKNTILVGHGIENDLNALNLYTENVIDTSYLFLNSQGFKVKLNVLAKKYLNIAIQNETHDSYEDAYCTLRLLNRKVEQIKSFLGNLNGEFLEDKNNSIKIFNDNFTDFINAKSDDKNLSLGIFNIKQEELRRLYIEDVYYMIFYYNSQSNINISFKTKFE